MMTTINRILLIITVTALSSAGPSHSGLVVIRLNQLGYLTSDTKMAIVLSDTPIKESAEIINEQTNTVAMKAKPIKVLSTTWRADLFSYTIDFSNLATPGIYRISLKKAGAESAGIIINDNVYNGYQEDLLKFMRQQRCGYNPFIDEVCHQGDGRSFYGPPADSTYYDLSGGWHDAGDQLKYLITSSNATARMLLAYEVNPGLFEDQYNALGQTGPNGIRDVLDEARWGLDWILKMYALEDILFHQVADDRDHLGWKWPHKDPSDYGWGPNSYRTGYVATGQPQGLGKYKSKATGIANLAGRSAAALALGSRLFDKDPSFSEKCKTAAISLYALGKKMEGYQQGNSYGAPYRYNEETWIDDMEWAAAELFKTTGQDDYLADAIKYARMIGSQSMLLQDTAAHYQYYPFMNMGHYALFPSVDGEMQQQLSAWYREALVHVKSKAERNGWGIGTPFIWCSNNVMVNFVTQALLYEKMTGDSTYHDLLLMHCDWLMGRNPWGTSMFTGIPADGEYPLDVHTSIWILTGKVVPGGLIDGPIWKTIHDKLLGLELTQPDEFASFQNDYVVYHDDIGDYATNEPTMDGTADAIFMMALLAQCE